jgi:hypothetical protein
MTNFTDRCNERELARKIQVATGKAIAEDYWNRKQAEGCARELTRKYGESNK